MKYNLNLEDKNNVKECFNTICAEIEALGYKVPGDITADDMRDGEGFRFGNVSVSFYWDEDGQFAEIEATEEETEATEEAETEETTEEAKAEEAEAPHIVEIAIISKFGRKYAVTYFSDGTIVETDTATPEMMNFINLMVARDCFEIIFGGSGICVKFGGCYKNTDEFDISISVELDIRLDEHAKEMPFDRLEEGTWYHATGYSIMVGACFITEYVASA